MVPFESDVAADEMVVMVIGEDVAVAVSVRFFQLAPLSVEYW